MKFYLAPYLLICTLVFSSCVKELDKEEYFNFFNGYMDDSYIEVQEGDYLYQLQARPSAFLALNEAKSDKKLSNNDIEKLAGEYDADLDFCLRISSVKQENILGKDNKDKRDYFRKIELLSSSFPLMICGISANDTTRCSLHHFERTYNIRPFVQVLFTLKKEDQLPNKILFKDQIFQNGKSILFPNFKDYYNNLPELNL